eukprot:CAMPEP_0113498890 /NCGR_PEP_ID=MMETSP0014_2-20120614/31439_1 /TAXON_ID=2857 /ORGANISM="Nitzschia sp." /LENGTH=552 /DNA_ID=CAMNT_0000392995 /DNA_START=353 /DNA_END=2011 /DNA_ORIENTATION=+ /assembly_acc=CAM_ASM_000159
MSDGDDSNIQLLPSSKYVPLVVIQVLVATISFVSSIVVIRISGGKLQSVYQRNVFTLTVSIVLVAITLILQPFLVPPPPQSSSQSSLSPSYYWSSGSDGSCTAVGFLLIFSTLCLGFYSIMLALYFYFSIQADRPKRSRSNSSNTTIEKQPENVIGWPERMGHVICWVIPIALAATGIGLDQYRLDTSINMCILVEGEPLREIYQWMLFGTVVISIAVSVIIQFQVRDALNKIAASKSDNRRNNTSNDNDDDDNNNNVETEEVQEMIKQKFSAVSIQCALYTGVCSVCSVFYVVLIFLPTDGNNNSNLIYTFQILTAIFYPLLGVFNCIIYVRPRVQMLQIMYPDDPYIVVLRVGMSTAGDADEIEQIRVKVFGANYVAPSRGGSQLVDGEGEEDASGDEQESLGEIPSFVHLDKDKQEMSVYSFVSTPGENDDDADGGGGNSKNSNNNIASGIISPLADPPPRSSLPAPISDPQDSNAMTKSGRSGSRGGLKEVFGPTGSVLVSSTADNDDDNDDNNGSRSNHNTITWKRSSDVWSQVRPEDQEEDEAYGP